MRPAPLPAAGAAVAFVGAGGAGKTRCAAALASAYRRGSTLSVMALSLGDADDSRTIETLLATEGVPVKHGAEVRSLARMVRDVRVGGVVIVDTPAIAPGDRAAVLTLAEQLEPLRLDGVFVAVPATIGPQAARQLLSGLEPLHLTGIAVTHVDETDQLGVAVELACAIGAPIAYVHEGLDLRRALSAPDPVGLAARLLP
jgi:flagellar biosynthesis GTPase FlhF